MTVIVSGAGPAGAVLASLLKHAGIDVVVYEAFNRPGLKPCGWGVPREIEEYIYIPGSSILVRLKGYRVYLDGSLIHEDVGSRTWGYIVDKPRFLEHLLSNVEVHYGSRAPRPRPGDIHVIATGHYYPGSPEPKILAIQYIVDSISVEDDVLEVWFDRSMVGYTWVFPEGEGRGRIGIGGFKDFHELKKRLDKFMEKHPGLRNARILRLEGARLVVGGISRSIYSPEKPVIGEALGTVYPLTGEGIRPSIASAVALARSMSRGTDFWSEFRSTGVPQGIALQRRILDFVVKAGPDARAALLRELPRDVMAKLTLGKASKRDLLEALARRPKLLLLLARYGVMPRHAPHG